jgi:hypothetical protein
MLRRWVTAVCLLLSSVLAAAPAFAESSTCRMIRMQMDRAGSGGGGGNPAQAAKYARAIDAQNGQIGKARAQMRALNCGSGGGGSGCQKLNAALRSMNANMSKLKAQYARLSRGGGGGSESRKALRARYYTEGCQEEEDAGTTVVERKRKAEEKRRDNGIAAVFGETNSSREKRKEKVRIEIPGLDFGGDTFRTLCVRTCDGYYFPVSFSTTKENFKRDLKACESMCPGTEVKLFMHKVPEEESEDMKTDTGEPYKAMSYAFAYRRDGLSTDAACKCAPVQGMTVASDGKAGSSGIASTLGNGKDAKKDKRDAPVPVPLAKADPTIDRETMADKAGNFDDAEIRAMLGKDNGKVADGQNASAEDVRVVGPIFLPDPSGAIELRAPVRPLVR